MNAVARKVRFAAALVKAKFSVPRPHVRQKYVYFLLPENWRGSSPVFLLSCIGLLLALKRGLEVRLPPAL